MREMCKVKSERTEETERSERDERRERDERLDIIRSSVFFSYGWLAMLGGSIHVPDDVGAKAGK